MVVDDIGTLNRMKQNLTLIHFAIAELNYGREKLSLGAIKLNSFVYLARLALYQVLIVSIQFLPRFLIVLIGTSEIFCLCSGLYLINKHNHIREKRTIIHRIIQNIAIFFFLVLNFIIASKNASFNEQVPSLL